MRAVLLLCCLPLLASAASLLGSNQPCWNEKKELNARKEAAGGILPAGASYPDCDRLGRYSPQQCKGSKCFCVDPSGQPLRDSPDSSKTKYTVNIWEKEQQSCRCSRVELENSLSGNVGASVRCDSVGDYHHTQCLESQCYCVHTHTGEQLQGQQWQSHETKLKDLTDKCEQAAAGQQ